MASLRPSFRAFLRRLIVASAIVAPLMAAVPARAQSTAYPAITDVDPASALGRYLRMLASNPRDLASLTGAGRAALAVGDANAALGFYARAEEIAPRNGRIKAGLASALVQMEQPRAALKFFGEAVALGVPTGEIAADRGLAHDLLGDNRRAQADYTIALRARDDDETVRRLALSMAVSGDRGGALTILDPLLRRRDAGAERARAFVLALTGDQAGAAGAVRAAMPGAQATAMLGFMNRLTTLNPAQKALAVNFGYFPSDGRAYTAAELFADARAAPLPSPGTALTARDPRRDPRADTPLIPFGEALGPRLASNEPVSVAPRRRPGQMEVLPPPHVLSAPIPGVTAVPTTSGRAVAPSSGTGGATVPTAPAPAGTGGVATPTGVGPQSPVPSVVGISGAAGATTTPPSTSGPAPSIAGAPAARGGPATTPAPARFDPAASPLTPGAGQAPSTGAAQPIGFAAMTGATAAAPADSAIRPAPVRIATVELPAATARATVAATGPQVEPVQPLRAPVVRSEPRRAPPTRSATATSRPATPSRATSADAAFETAAGAGASTSKGRAKGAAAGRGETADTAKAEKGQSGTSKGTRLASLDPKTKKPLSARSTDQDATRETRPPRNGRSRTDGSDDGTTSSGRAGATGRTGTKGGADAADTGSKTGTKGKASAKAATDAKDKADATDKAVAKGKADTKGKADAKTASAAEEKAGAKGKTATAGKSERYWVQVASGSNKAHLDKAWSEVKGKAPKQLSGQTTYTAPWRASNRLLIGPFKSEEEAQAKVNSLAKAGVSGIQFTTRAGADVEKIATK